MTLKRTLELAVEDDDHSLTNDDREPPLKRRQFSVPQTPLPKSSGLGSYSSARTPSTPYPSRPSDSPSNPFGRKRLLTLTHTLPPPTSFSEHLPLRFQLSRPGISPRLGGVYRIVQVPLSYTFVHLRCLILYLFGGGYVADKQDRHIFQVKKNIVIYNQTYKPCQIKTGVTVVKLSSARDPGRYRPKSDEDALLGDTNDNAHNGAEHASEAESNESEEDEDWFWAAEEDFTLGHAWPRGGDITRGIIYQHTPTTVVHITINTAPLPKRKGRSNIPYVFCARGRVRLLPSTPFPLPRPLFSVPTHKLASPTSPRRRTRSLTTTRSGSRVTKQTLNAKLTDKDDKNDNDTRSGHEDEDDEDKDDHAAMPKIDKWNTYRGFSKYLKLAHEHGRLFATLYEEDEDEDEDEAANEVHHYSSTPGLTHSYSSSPMSSSSDLPSPGALYSSSESISVAQPHGLPILPFGCTPAPQHAQWQRLQIERVSKRMERLKKGEWICARDEDLDEEDLVDELTGEDDDKSSVKPVLKPGEVWDPFGDEYEI